MLPLHAVILPNVLPPRTLNVVSLPNMGSLPNVLPLHLARQWTLVFAIVAAGMRRAPRTRLVHWKEYVRSRLWKGARARLWDRVNKRLQFSQTSTVAWEPDGHDNLLSPASPRPHCSSPRYFDRTVVAKMTGSTDSLTAPTLVWPSHCSA